MYKAVVDILRGVNANVLGGVEGAQKASTIVKGGLSVADSAIGVSHAIEDFQCQDYVCFTLDLVGSVSSALGLVLGNIPATKSVTTITGIVTVGCRSVRYYCKEYGTVWGCTVAAGHGIKHTIKVMVPKL